MKNWKQVRLGDVCEILSSKRIFAKEYVTEGVPFYRGKEIIEKQKGNDISTELFISRERYEELKDKSGVPSKGDILLTSVGTLGVPWVVNDIEFYFKDGNLTWFRNFNDIDSSFLYYWILSSKGKEQIEQKCIGSTQRALTIETLRKFEIDLPPLEEQERIAAILGSLDDKIELNNRINKNSEEQASALFKRWFVDFEFPDENGNPYRTAGGKFTDSPLGQIPDGWTVGVFGDVITPKKGKNLTRSQVQEGNIPVIAGGLSPSCFHNSANTVAPVITVSASGANAGYVWLHHSPIWSSDSSYIDKSITDVVYFAYVFLTYNQNKIYHKQQGCAQPHIYPSHIKELDFVIPKNTLMTQFENTVSCLFKKINNNDSQSEVLIQLRDSLLHKLMNNEI